MRCLCLVWWFPQGPSFLSIYTKYAYTNTSSQPVCKYGGILTCGNVRNVEISGERDSGKFSFMRPGITREGGGGREGGISFIRHESRLVIINGYGVKPLLCKGFSLNDSAQFKRYSFDEINSKFQQVLLGQPCFLPLLRCILYQLVMLDQHISTLGTGNMIRLNLQPMCTVQAVIILTGLLLVVFISEISLWQLYQTLCPLGNHQSIWSGILDHWSTDINILVYQESL